MFIAILFTDEELVGEGQEIFFTKLIAALAEQYPENNYLIVCENNFRNTALLQRSNIICESITLKNPAFFYNWRFQKKAEGIIVQKKAEVILSIGKEFSFSQIPHYAFLSTTNRKIKIKALKKLSGIITTSTLHKELLIKEGIKSDDVAVVYGSHCISSFQKTEEEKTDTRERLTGGKEFFYCEVSYSLEKVITLLKAFSIFKKRQKSNMKLLISGTFANSEMINLVETYRFKEDVVLPGNFKHPEMDVDEDDVIGCAYAFITVGEPNLCKVFGAMAIATPILASHHSILKEVSDNGALYFNPDDVGDVADKLMLIYKDESLAKKLVEEGKNVASSNTWEKTAPTIQQMLTHRRTD